jgi:hypothetical protein
MTGKRFTHRPNMNIQGMDRREYAEEYFSTLQKRESRSCGGPLSL